MKNRKKKEKEKLLCGCGNHLLWPQYIHKCGSKKFTEFSFQYSCGKNYDCSQTKEISI